MKLVYVVDIRCGDVCLYRERYIFLYLDVMHAQVFQVIQSTTSLRREHEEALGASSSLVSAHEQDLAFRPLARASPLTALFESTWRLPSFPLDVRLTNTNLERLTTW